MRTWFLCKVKYAKENEQGLLKNVSEQYLVDAVSFTEAEARIYDMLGSVIRGDFQVTNISKSNIVDVFFYEDSDVWYKCKITYVVADVKDAYDRIFESLNNMLVSFVVPDINESPIVEIFPYEKDDEELQPTYQGNAVTINEEAGTVKIQSSEEVEEEEVP